MKLRSVRLAVAIVALATTASVAAQSLDLSYCITCHGANGNGNPAIRAPKIAGMEPWYLKRQLDAFAAGTRGVDPADESGHEMQPVGLRLKQAGITDQAIEFVGTFRATNPTATVTGDQDRGKTLYATCAACHGAKGEGNAALTAPALASRSDWYLITQLKNFSTGVRGGDGADAPSAQMRAIAQTLTDTAAVNDVVAYINTLR